MTLIKIPFLPIQLIIIPRHRRPLTILPPEEREETTFPITADENRPCIADGKADAVAGHVVTEFEDFGVQNEGRIAAGVEVVGVFEEGVVARSDA